MSRMLPLSLAAALATTLTVFPAQAQDWGYVGTTQQTFDGGQGYFAPHEACMARFKGVWCTSRMILEKAPHPLAFGPPPEPVPGGGGVGGAWVNPVITGAGAGYRSGDLLDGFVIDIAGNRGSLGPFAARTMNCDGWSLSDGEVDGLGLTLQTREDGSVELETELCGIPRPAACCGGVPRVPRPLPRENNPIDGVQ